MPHVGVTEAVFKSHGRDGGRGAGGGPGAGVERAPAGDRSREPVGGLSGSVLGAGLSRPVSVRFLLYVGVLAERRARLPGPGLRPQRRRDAGGTELRSPDL